jgi:hypothetical protein
MRRTISACVISLLLLAFAPPASTQAAVGYDSSYFGESAFLAIAPGTTGQFAAGFNNTGVVGWQTGTSSQVNLAICAADKVTCNITSPNAAWASGWYSTSAYATQSTSFVGPGQTGWFVYSVRAPATASGTARFNGDVALASTGQLVHPEGYFQEATVQSGSAGAMRLDVSPSYQTAQIGTFPLVTATLTTDPPSSSTTRTPVANTAVTFEVTNTNPLNPPQTFTMITNASGVAAITYTRNNTGTDSIVAYVTATPAVRGNANVVWSVKGSAITVTPKDNQTRANDASGCRAYSYVANNPTTGQPQANAPLRVNFLENINRTSDQDGGATIEGISPTPTAPVAVTSSAAGTGTFTVCGNGSTARVTPMLFDNFGNANTNLLEAGDSADAGGSITFQTRVPVLTVTPTDSGGRVVGDQRVYTISAVDQFGAAYTGPVRIGFQELTDSDPATTTGAYITWVDNDASLATGGASGPAAPAGATDIPDVQSYLLSALNGAGQATFGIYAPSATSGRPVVWVDANTNAVLDAGEASALGGATTWAASSLSGCSLTRSKGPLVPTSTGSANAGVLSEGDVFVVFTFRDQSGTVMTPPSPTLVTFQVTNTGGATIALRVEGQSADTMIGGGSTMTQSTPNAISGSTTYAIVDSAGATAASVSASATVGGVPISCGPLSLRWVAANAEPTSGSLNGTVIDLDKGSNTSDGGSYVLQTPGGNYVIGYSNRQTLIVTSTVATEAQFEAALSNGDTVLWTYSSGAESHNITTNVP